MTPKIKKKDLSKWDMMWFCTSIRFYTPSPCLSLFYFTSLLNLHCLIFYLHHFFRNETRM